MRAPAPNVYVEDVAAPPCKRQRLDLSETNHQRDQSVALPAGLARPTDSNADTLGKISDDTIVCFGMVRTLMASTVVSAHIARF